MQSLVIDRVGHTAFQEVAEQDLGHGQVLVEVHHVGLCGTDLKTYQGENPLAKLPRIPGHEIGGVIVARDENADPDYVIGARVIVIPYTTCGQCTACRAERVNACQYNRTLGVQQDGGMRSKIVLNTDRLILNNTLRPSHLALVEPLSVGFHAVARGRIEAHDRVLVLGGGIIGVAAILGARARGARVIVSEVAAGKQQTLLALGVDAVINPAVVDLGHEVARLTDGKGVDVVIEAVGAPQTFREAIELAPFAGRVVYIGYAKEEVSYDTKYFNLKELDIMGSRNATLKDFEAVIEYLTAHPTIGDRLISKVVPWSEADGAFSYWMDHRDNTFKVLIDMEAR